MVQTTNFETPGYDQWKLQELEGLLRYLRRRIYEDDIAAGRLPIPILNTDYPIALDTNDTSYPRGAVHDNSICYRFNEKLALLFLGRPQLKVLDLGCAGGGFVRSLIDDGHFAVGLEGCGVPRLLRLGEWGTIPRHLFTCDLTKQFGLVSPTGKRIRFDVITAWEFLEHIQEADVPQVMENVAEHLARGGLFFASIAMFPDTVGTTIYHQTIQSKDWWVALMNRIGFEVAEQSVITDDDWVRGAGNCRFDYRAEADGRGFHLVLKKSD